MTDPRAKITIREAILTYLYAPTVLQRTRRLEELAIKNALVGGFSHKSFVYRGEVYNADTTHPPLRRIQLLPEFRPLIDEWLADKAEIEAHEEPMISGMLSRILTSCFDARDVVKILPDTFAQPVREHMMALVSDKRLSSDKIEALRAENEHPIQLMRERMVLNLLL